MIIIVVIIVLVIVITGEAIGVVKKMIEYEIVCRKSPDET